MSGATNSTALTRIPEEDDRKPSGSNSTGPVVVLDSLPYIDNIHPDYEAYALTLIEDEMQHMQEQGVPSGSLDHLPNPLGGEGGIENVPITFREDSLNRTEYKNVLQRGGEVRSQSKDYVQSTIASEPETSSKENWEKALEQAKIELEHERLRLLNNELQTEYESNLWKYYNMTLEDKYVKPLSDDLRDQRMAVDQLNAKRKEMQEGSADSMVIGGSGAAQKLHILGARWGELVGSNQRLVKATTALEEEVQKLRSSAGVDSTATNDTDMKTD